MKPSTRKWLKGLIVNDNNSKAIEVRDYIDELESQLSWVPVKKGYVPRDKEVLILTDYGKQAVAVWFMGKWMDARRPSHSYGGVTHFKLLN
ncbi:MAG: hypothetical protein ACXQTI_06930 [Candidatus Nezhaarchaeales archaeon]